MSVLFETSVGDLVVDLDTENCPIVCKNFLKLCKVYYYNFCAIFNVQKDFVAQTGDPSNTGNGGKSIYGLINGGDKDRYLKPDIHQPPLKHIDRGTLSMVVSEGLGCGSQFFFTLAPNVSYLDGKHVPFGRIVVDEDEGNEQGGSMATLDKINETFVDDKYRPLRDIRIRHVIVLDDPYDDPEGLIVPENSPEPTKEMLQALRVGEDEELDDDADQEEVEKRRRMQEAKAQALTLEMVGDLPFADVRPPENVLFVCKLNRVTQSEDLELIFSRFGTILSCEVIKEKTSGESLQYAFIEFDKREDAERAYEKMDNVLIDDRRIHVDFSQSVAKLHGDWVYQRTGGRAPPNKGKSRKEQDDMVFDLGEKDDYERHRQRPRNQRGNGRRNDHDQGRRDGGNYNSRGGRSGGDRNDRREYRDNRDNRNNRDSDYRYDHDPEDRRRRDDRRNYDRSRGGDQRRDYDKRPHRRDNEGRHFRRSQSPGDRYRRRSDH